MIMANEEHLSNVDGVISIRVIGISGKEGKGENHFAQPRGICMDPRFVIFLIIIILL